MQKDDHKYCILIVEDNPGDLLLVCDYLEEEIVAPEILSAQDFAAAHQLLGSMQPGIIDVILLDLSLPDKEGEDLLRSILAVSGNIPVVVLTGYSDVNFAKRSLSLGVSDYLLKDNLNGPMLHKSIVYNIERNKYLSQIKDSEERYSDMFHLSPQPMWVYDLETMQMLDVNNAAIQHYGYNLAEFLSLSPAAIEPGFNSQRNEKNAEISAPGLSGLNEVVHVKKNGDTITVDVRSNVIFYNGRRAAVVLASDITDRIVYTKAIEEQNSRLRDIAWTQSHIVRAPLARIMALIDVLKIENTSQNEQQELLQHIIDSSYELDAIIRDIVKKADITDQKQIDKL